MERNISVTENGHLSLGGVDAVSLAKQFHTPLYVLEEDKVRSAIAAYRSSMNAYYDGRGLVCYASKALCCKELCRIAAEEGIGLDVVSLGELYTACSVDFPMERICFHGNNKSVEELTFALEKKVGYIVVDGLTELETLSRLAKEKQTTASILLRIKPGVDAHTHNFIRTGQIDSKFGFALETGEAMEGVLTALKTENIALKGVHCHIGSQILETEPFVHAAKIMMEFIRDIRDKTGVEMQVLDLGGGFGIRYTDEDDPIPYVEYLKDVSGTIKDLCHQYSLSLPSVIIEPGRSIVGEAGTTLYTVGCFKEIPNVRTYLAVDGGMGDNPRYALYGSKYDMLLANRATEKPVKTYTVAGKCCESGDLLEENIPLPEAKVGDILAVLSTGAYNYSMASRYNRNPIPPTVMVKDGTARIIIKGDSLEVLIRNDV